MTNLEKTEAILIVLWVIGLIFILNDLPGGAFILAISAGLLSILYYAFSFLLFNRIRVRKAFTRGNYKNTNAKRIIGSIGVGISLSTLLVGILFKIQAYPGASIMLTIGLLLLSIVVVPGIFGVYRNGDRFYKGMLVRILSLGLLGLLLFSIPMKTLLDFRFRNDPDRRDLLKEMIDDPNNPELQKRLDELNQNPSE